ncbi:hypothetical protein SHJG_1607 [Streptomyces hygroscopicus subsp. jinggangensis 5008]|nr:hypothetical protein SHJG_1607 [Streptomyces hygroscopicus subsp. jinggangensis 5008]
MEEITAPGDDTENEQHTYTKLLIATGGYRRRHHRAGPDILDPRPAGLNSENWDLLTDAIDQYTHARVRRRLEQTRTRTAAEPATLCPHPTPAPIRAPPPPARPAMPDAVKETGLPASGGGDRHGRHAVDTAVSVACWYEINDTTHDVDARRIMAGEQTSLPGAFGAGAARLTGWLADPHDPDCWRATAGLPVR